MHNRADASMVTVCAACHRASCWHGVLFCSAATYVRASSAMVSELRPLDLEHSHYWTLSTDKRLNTQVPKGNLAVSGMSLTSLLLWIKRGRYTLEDAVRSGRAAHIVWASAHEERLFLVEPGGRLFLTEDGVDEITAGALHA